MSQNRKLRSRRGSAEAPGPSAPRAWQERQAGTNRQQPRSQRCSDHPRPDARNEQGKRRDETWVRHPASLLILLVLPILMAAYQARRPSQVLATTEVVARSLNPMLFTLLVMMVASRTSWTTWLRLLCTMVAPVVAMVHLPALQAYRAIASLLTAISNFALS